MSSNSGGGISAALPAGQVPREQQQQQRWWQVVVIGERPTAPPPIQPQRPAQHQHSNTTVEGRMQRYSEYEESDDGLQDLSKAVWRPVGQAELHAAAAQQQQGTVGKVDQPHAA